MDFIRFIAFLATVLFCIIDSKEQKVLRRSKRNHVSCRPKSLVRYRLTVHTLWSKQTFPKMFPTYRPHAQWSSLVGRTHGSEYHMWKQGANATAGVKLFAEQGDSSHLDIESVQGYGYVLDSFVAPPVGTGVGQTSAVIILDGHHSRLSFMMRIIPSPDWFIGISSLDLCAHGRWKNKVQVDLRPFDAGTDQGLTFTAPNWPNVPVEPIFPITSSFPDHPASSFLYPEYEELPALAYMELDIVSEFRHRETFMEVPQNLYKSTSDGDIEAEKKLKEAELSMTTAASESRFARLLFTNNDSRPNERVALTKSNSSSVVGNTSAATNSQDPSNSGRVNTQEMKLSQGKGSSLKAEMFDDDIVHLHREKKAEEAIIQQSKNINDSKQNTVPKIAREEVSTQSVTDEHNDLRSNVQTEDSHVKVEGNKSDDSRHMIKDRGDEQSDVLHKETSKISYSSEDTESTSEAVKTHSPFSFDRFGIPEASTQNMADFQDSPSVDCEVGEWSEWSTCSQTCGFGQQERTRNVSSYPQNGGANCPRLRQANLCGSMRSCSWQHFSFLEPNTGTSKRQLREGPTRHRRIQPKRIQ